MECASLTHCSYAPFSVCADQIGDASVYLFHLFIYYVCSCQLRCILRLTDLMSQGAM
jgi:hypothetical protein